MNQLNIFNSHVARPFASHPLLRGGHAQTLAGVYLPSLRFPYRAVQRQVPLRDGDALVVHDDCPTGWEVCDRSVVLVHGLSGDYRSGYMQRFAGKLNERGVRTFRLDMRGAGAGAALARRPYHGGCSDDVAAALKFIAQLCPSSPTTLIGFSLGGNVALKLLGELGAGPCGNLIEGIAVSPPVELETACRRLQERQNRIYDRHFVDQLLRQNLRRTRIVPGAARVRYSRRPKSLLEFDDLFTAPVNGFGNAANYYQSCSSARLISSIRLPTLILTAADDPMIPVEIFERLQYSTNVSLTIAKSGGHLGFIGRGGIDPDRRWMDWRLLEWMFRETN